MQVGILRGVNNDNTTWIHDGLICMLSLLMLPSIEVHGALYASYWAANFSSIFSYKFVVLFPPDFVSFCVDYTGQGKFAREAVTD